MATNQKTSVLVAEQLPDFVRDEGPKLQRFIEAYYEFMEQNGGAIDGSKNLLSYQDIDTTTDTFLQFFREEVYKNIPDSALVDKRLLAKHIREMYRNKGTEKSYKFLFRALFNEDVELSFPGDFLLKPSDGRWTQEKYLRLTGVSGVQAATIEGEIIRGVTSNAYARIERVDRVTELGQTLTEVYLSSIVGTFANNEVISTNASSTGGTITSPGAAALQEKTGRYTATKGFLSNDQRLQDSNFYQDFSYVVRSPQFIDRYRETILELLHPAGTKLFGETVIISPFNVRSQTTDTLLNVNLNIENEPISTANTSNVVSFVDPAFNVGVGTIFIPNYATINDVIAGGVNFGVSPTIGNYGGILISDLNSRRLVFGNNTTFSSTGLAVAGFVSQNPSNANNLLGFGGTNFAAFQANDAIYVSNTSGSSSHVVRVVSTAGASSMVTSPAINATAFGFHQRSANSTVGGRLITAQGVRVTDDIIIFDTYGGTPDGQYAIRALSTSANSSNIVMSIYPNFEANTLSNGSFAVIRTGSLIEPPFFDSTKVTFDANTVTFDAL